MADEITIKENGARHPEYSGRFQRMLKKLDKRGLRYDGLFNMYLELRDAELASCPNKETKDYKLYDYLMRHRDNDEFFEVIFKSLEAKVGEITGE